MTQQNNASGVDTTETDKDRSTGQSGATNGPSERTTESYEQEISDLRAEAARYRTKAKDMQTGVDDLTAERDQALADLETSRADLEDTKSLVDAARAELTKQFVERYAQVTPDALWSVVGDPLSLLDDDGRIDLHKMAEAEAEARSKFGIRNTRKPTGVLRSGAGREVSSGNGEPTWGTLLNG